MNTGLRYGATSSFDICGVPIIRAGLLRRGSFEVLSAHNQKSLHPACPPTWTGAAAPFPFPARTAKEVMHLYRSEVLLLPGDQNLNWFLNSLKTDAASVHKFRINAESAVHVSY